MEIYHADYDENNPQIASNEPIHIPDSEIKALFTKPKNSLLRRLKRKLRTYFWHLKHRLVIALQLRIDNPVLYKRLVDLRKSWGAY